MRVSSERRGRSFASGIAVAALASLLIAAPPAHSSPAVSRDTETVAGWVRTTGDNQGTPFAIVDKKAAAVHIFDADGKRRASSPILLGLAKGDHSVPGIGERQMADIRDDERTTPAGRFVSEPGRNLSGEDIVWVDYDAAVSMHRVRATNKAERRLERLATPTAADNRISYGCINVPAAFYDAHVKPSFGTAKAVIYVLPETRPASTLFETPTAQAR
ncbi:L,D-transpeptidase [Variovorax sp. CCNWLW225]|jgi:hypothetical protein|uniref:L,D-transpeptidase n=1 Tax=unclassified Variovorax TaxID=663243 RepID=UPI00215C239F|nr:L,D-transpeptidase [Variovorax sp. S12S4]MCR8958253.1 L,D-transpeptidase [Variovorax sp. S12S4]